MCFFDDVDIIVVDPFVVVYELFLEQLMDIHNGLYSIA
jgi:hypothetical protein